MIINKRKKATVLWLILFFCRIFLGCGFVVFDEVTDYDKFINNLVQYHTDKEQGSEENELPVIKEPSPEIKGFESLFEDISFSYAKSFYGAYTFAAVDSKYIILSKNGTYIETEFDLSNYDIKYDRYIYTDGILSGVKDIFGNIVVPAQFDTIEIKGRTALATKNKVSSIFIDKTLINTNIIVNVSLLNDKYLLASDGVYNLDMTPLIAGDYYVINTLNDTTYLIYEELLLGAADIDLNIIAAPKYKIIYNVIDGWLCVQNNNFYEIISPKGEIVFSDNNVEPLYYDGKYMIYKEGSFLGVADSDFNKITEPIFLAIQNNSVYNDCLIVGTNIKQFYSIKNRTLIEDNYISITPFKDYYICEDNAKNFSLKDKNLNTLIDKCEFIEWSEEILLICKNEKWYFYSEL